MSAADYKLTWTFDGRTVEVDLTEPISEILIRAYSDKVGTETEIRPQRFTGFFKKCEKDLSFKNADKVISRAEGAKWRRISLEHLSQKFRFEGTTTFRFDASDPPLRSHLAFQMKLNCNTPAIKLPSKTRISAFPWRFNMKFVPGGMEAINVRSHNGGRGYRKMAREIYVPHCRIFNNKQAGLHLFQLMVPDDHWVKNHLIRFQFFRKITIDPTADPGVHVAKATFQLGSKDECARITQWYEMHPRLNPWNDVDRSKLPFPTTGVPGNIVADKALYPVEKFLPITYYEWLPKCKDVVLKRMEISSRANWPAGRRVRNPKAFTRFVREASSNFGRDPDSVTSDWTVLWRYGLEFIEVDTIPLPDEPRMMKEHWVSGFINNVFNSGLNWDNYHYNPIDREIGAPGGLAGIIAQWTPPGCPECVHIHWRWGTFLVWPDGQPLIPKKEKGCWSTVPKQSLSVLGIRDRISEKRDFLLDLTGLTGENLYLNVGKRRRFRSKLYAVTAFKQAFGYFPYSKATSNAFFAHGISYNGLYSNARERNYYRAFRLANPPTSNN